MSRVDSVVAWAQSLGMGGAFFLITLSAFGVCGLALWVALAALKRGES